MDSTAGRSTLGNLGVSIDRNQIAGEPVPRILAVLGTFATLFYAMTMILGMSLGDVRNPNDLTTQNWATVHRLSGVAAALVIVLADCIVITYFIGTARWCREVVDTYSLDQNLVRRSAQLKRRTFPIATISMLVVVGVVALGGAADPAASIQQKLPGGLTWADMHLWGALVGLVVIGAGFAISRNNVQAHLEIIDEVMAEVRRVREERGLEVAS